jgi:hypothetical protein
MIKTNTMKNCYLSLLAATCVVGQLSAQTLATYQATVTGQAPANYFKLDSSLVSAVNPGVSLIQQGTGGGFTYDAFANPANSFFYETSGDELANETDPLINTSGTTNGPINKKGSITFLFRSLSGPKVSGEGWLFDGRALFSSAATSNHNALALWFERTDFPGRTDPGSLKLEFGDTEQVILQTNDLVFSTWYYFALTWDESRVPNKAIWYLGRSGGSLMTGTTTNVADAVAGEGTGLFIGNRSSTSGSFSRPGNGRIDEFAIWSTELSPTQVSNQFANLPAGTSGGLMVTNVIVNDSFADGDRTATGPLQANWWSSSSTSGNSVEAYTNQLGLVSGTSGRGLHGTFAPQTLAIGETIRATYTFTTPATVGAGSGSTAFKMAMMDFNDAGLAADLSSASATVNPLYTNLPGYMADYDVYTTVVASADVGIREHITPNTSGRFLGTTTEWTASGSSADAGYVFAANTEYSGVFSITRTDFDSVDIYTSLSQGASLMDSFTSSDSSQIANNYGMLGFWANSSAFGSTTAIGETEDNGITFSNIKVETVTFSTAKPSLSITASGANAILSWPASFTGYALESTPSLSTPVWTGAGASTVVGTNNVVTNALTAIPKYYRLKK